MGIEIYRTADELRSILRRIRSRKTSMSRISRPRNKNRFFKERSLYEYEKPYHVVKEMNNNLKDIFLGASDITDFLTSNIINNRLKNYEECHYDSVEVYMTKPELGNYIKQFPSSQYRHIQVMDDRGYIVCDSTNCYIEYRIHSTHTSIEFLGDKSFTEEMMTRVQNQYEIVMNKIEWVYSNDGQSMVIPLTHDKMPVEEMYPFLNGQSLESYYTNFMNSSASILLLIGPPGTGKTTFIRGMLQHSNVSAMVTYDSSILEKDYVFANFVEGDRSVLVVEDADMFLKSRQDGNSMMHKFLNVGDGLVTTRNKKMVFSTNLPSINDIDPALIRPGRCYDIIHFSELTQEEAESLAKKCGVTLDGKRSKWSIADVFFERNTNSYKPVVKKMGFV